MADDKFPALDADRIAETRDALHGYARVAGGWAASTRRQRKHWWHASLRPSLYGVTTGVIFGHADFELEVDFANSQFHVRSGSTRVSERLSGQSSRSLAARVKKVLTDSGVDEKYAPGDDKLSDTEHAGYLSIEANRLHRALGSVAGALEHLRSGMPEEQSPIQVWPHHFDLSMIWLPGFKIAAEDPTDDEASDKQMNFGFVFGDESIPEPYFYVTAYPTSDAMSKLDLPGPASWHTDGLNGAVVLYSDVSAMPDPNSYLLTLWNVLLEAGREQLAVADNGR